MSTRSKSPSLDARIRAEIEGHGPLPFSRFMEMALYDAEHGYYASGKAAIGKAGDYYTNVSTGAVFGKILSRQFEEVWEAMRRPKTFSIVEQGAFDGQFAADVLEDSARRNPDFFSALTYWIVEPFPRLREKQQGTLASFGKKLKWPENPSQLPPVEGIFFGNELVDAMPVELVEWDGAQWRERRVAVQDENLAFATHAVENSALQRRLKNIPSPAKEEYRTEINLALEPWLEEVSQKFHRGLLLLCDYGYSRSVYYSPDRHEGTLSCYAKHKRSYDPLEHAGEKDISAHVDFTSLAESARQCGFEIAGFADQHHFLVGAGEKFLKEVEQQGINRETQRDLRAFQSLLHPETMGRAFHYIGFQKNLDVPISGFRHAPNGIQKLEIS